MEFWYKIVELLPFEWAKPDGMNFMKNAFLAVILISPIFGILGTIIVNNRMAFFSDALGHGAFTGVVIGAVFGLVQPLWAAVMFSLVFSALITYIKKHTRIPSDTIIGVFSSIAIALGILISTGGGRSFNKLMSYLIGDILSITPGEIALLALVLVVLLFIWIMLFNKFLLSSISRSLAASRRIPVFSIDLVLTSIIAVIVTISMSWIGLLVINSFLILPAAAARLISGNVRKYHAFSIIFALFSGITGLLLSYSLDTATGATIVLICAVLFFISFFLRKR